MSSVIVISVAMIICGFVMSFIAITKFYKLKNAEIEHRGVSSVCDNVTMMQCYASVAVYGISLGILGSIIFVLFVA